MRSMYNGWTGVAAVALMAAISVSAAPMAPPALASVDDEFELARMHPPGSGELRLEISLAARELYIYIDGDRVRTLPVSVGKRDHETITGSYGIHQVDWNPDWTPPDSDWSADSEYKAPGEEGNPMGRGRLIFRAPYSIHGTDDLASLGRAESHGSVRVSNEHVLGLARLVQEHGGAERSEGWYRNAADTPTEMFEVAIPEPVTIRIRD